jgi:YggT family protein
MGDFFLQFINLLLTVLWFAILARVVLSWFPGSIRNPIFVLIFNITEPILLPIRRVVPKVGMLDLSPTIAVILIFLIQMALSSAM